MISIKFKHVEVVLEVVVVHSKRSLLSVSKICEMGSLVSFGQNGGVIHHVESGVKTYFGRSNGIYVTDLYVPKIEVGF